ncbi:hypothetical protein GCM10009087_36000 [Sphingomonas oligophenolica]|uniref:Tetratricopeptide repeat protein n=1 Tax=Sphingomonas oligophenolica TaxID=301154 RepID=A0ABU9Y999_9SPHN
MKLVSHLAIAAALSLGIAAAPATAKEKNAAQAAAPKLSVSAAFAKPAQAAEAAIAAKDYATADTQISAAEAVAKNDDEHYYVAKMRLTIAANRQDNPAIAQQLEVLIANPKTPPADVVTYTYLRGSIAVDMKQDAQAIPFLLKARQLGSTSSDLPILLARAYGGTGKINEAIAEIDKAIAAETAAGRKAPDSWYGYAVSNLYASGNRAAAGQWLARELHEYPTAANWKTTILLYRDSADKAGTKLTRAQKVDLYRLMSTTKVLSGQGDYFDYAETAFLLGIPWETISVIDQGRASGVIPAGSASFTQLYNNSRASISNGSPLPVYEKEAAAAANGAKAAQTADAYLASGNNAKAVELYGMALTKGGVNADEVNLRLGTALVHLGRRDEAKAAFAKVSGPLLADIAHFWALWLDTPQLSS